MRPMYASVANLSLTHGSGGNNADKSRQLPHSRIHHACHYLPLCATCSTTATSVTPSFTIPSNVLDSCGMEVNVNSLLY